MRSKAEGQIIEPQQSHSFHFAAGYENAQRKCNNTSQKVTQIKKYSNEQILQMSIIRAWYSTMLVYILFYLGVHIVFRAIASREH